MKKIYALFAAACLPAMMMAQTYHGTVVNEENQPMQYVNVVLLQLPDSSFVSGVVTDEKGQFALDDKKVLPQPATPTESLLRLSSVGYQMQYLKPQEQMGTIQLMPDQTLLGEVVVKSNLPQVQMKGDAMVTHVQGSILEKAGTAEQLLDKVPSVKAKDGSVEVFGRGAAEIWLNGRKLQSNDELQRITSDNIASVEVISNPGARYSASTRAVIRIKTKKPLGDGFSFSDRAELGYKYDWSYLGQIDANYRKGGMDLTMRLTGAHNTNGSEQETNQDTYITRNQQRVNIHQQSDSRSRTENDALSAMVQFNYVAKDNSAIGARYQFDRTPSSDQSTDFPTDVSFDGKLTERSQNYITGRSDNYAHSTNLYYNGTIKGWTITWNGDGYWNRINSHTNSHEVITYNADGQVSNPAGRDVKSDLVYKNQMLATKLVIEHPFWGGQLTFGGEYDGNIRRNSYVGEAGITSDDLSKVHEQIASGFVEYGRRFGRFDTKFGLRYEHVNSDYYLFGNRVDEQSRTYGDLFPSVSISTVWGGKVWQQLSFGNDISRPSYSYLSNALVYVNRYTYSKGNPNLRPTYQRNITLNTSYNTLYVGLGYQHIKDAISLLMVPLADNPEVNCEQATNVNSYDHSYIVVSYNPQWSQKWHPMFALNAGYQNFEANTPDGLQKFDHPLFNFIFNNNFQLPKGYILDVNMIYIPGGDQMNIKIGSLFQNSLQLQKSFLKDRLNCVLSVSDPFELTNIKSDVYSGANVIKAHNFSQRQFMFTATYRFNQTRDKYRGQGAGASMKGRM